MKQHKLLTQYHDGVADPSKQLADSAHDLDLRGLNRRPIAQLELGGNSKPLIARINMRNLPPASLFPFPTCPAIA